MSSGALGIRCCLEVHFRDTGNRVRIRFCCKAYNTEYFQVLPTYDLD